MKNVFCGLLLLSCLASPCLLAKDAAPAQAGQVGRFQMTEATFTNAPGSTLQQFKRLAILDTVTGIVTVCDYAHKDAGKQSDGREYWLTNGSCIPFVGDKAWYLLKDKEPAKKELDKKEPVKEKALAKSNKK